MKQPLNQKDKRSGIRVPLLAEKLTYYVGKDIETADVGDITNEGVFLKTEKILPPNTSLNLHVQLPGDLGNLELEGKVVRVNWAINSRKKKEHLGMGVRFENLNASTKKILDAYVVYLRNKQIISVSKRILEEFFGPNNNGGPKKIR